MNVSQLNETCRGIVATLILALAGMGMIRLGWMALRDPERAKFWTDSSGVWFTKRLLGRTTAEDLQKRLRDTSRIKRKGIEGIILGTFFVIGAIVVLVLLVLGIR